MHTSDNIEARQNEHLAGQVRPHQDDPTMRTLLLIVSITMIIMDAELFLQQMYRAQS